MKSALLGTTAPLAHNPAGSARVQVAPGAAIAFADAEEEESGDKRMDALMDMIKDACLKMDEGGKRMDARMDSIEERLNKEDSAKKDAEEKEEKERADAARRDGDGETEEAKAKREAEEKERKDAEEAAEKERADAEEKEAKEKAEKERVEADAGGAPLTRAEGEQLRSDIAALRARAPAIISDADRERFASIQEKADPVFQAFSDRAPPPLEGETPTLYKRRLAGKMQIHSPNWKNARLSAIGDETSLDVAVDQIFADAISVGRRGADVPEGSLRAIKTVSDAGHTRIEYMGDTRVLTGMFSGHLQRA